MMPTSIKNIALANQQLQIQQQAQQQQLQQQQYHHIQQQQHHAQQQMILNHFHRQQQIIHQTQMRQVAQVAPVQQASSEQDRQLIDFITCKLCKGYLIDAVTLGLKKCLHSFCRPCAVKYVKDKQECPECKEPINDKRILNRLKPDLILQNIVYKLVPGLYQKEMARRREFYAARPTPTPRYKSEMFGDIPPSKLIEPDQMISLCLQCHDGTTELFKTYIHCRADFTIYNVKKFLFIKLGINQEYDITIHYKNFEIKLDSTTLLDVAATYDWPPDDKIMNLMVKVLQKQDSNTRPQSTPATATAIEN